MEKRAYDELKTMQDTYWWFIAKRKIICSLIEKYIKPNRSSKLRILDVGCGMGALLRQLSDYGDIYGMDCEEEAVNYCRTIYGERIRYGKLPKEIPFEEQSFDLVVLSDCLEHVDEDYESLKNIHGLLREEDSLLVLTVPALMSLWSYNDEFVHHKRRYDKQQLMDIVSESGYNIRMCSYYNFWLFPIVWIVRKIKNLFHIQQDDLNGRLPMFANKILTGIFASERWWLRKSAFPIGVSLILVAAKGDRV